jgi:hypothetical protein
MGVERKSCAKGQNDANDPYATLAEPPASAFDIFSLSRIFVLTAKAKGIDAPFSSTVRPLGFRWLFKF